MTNNNKYKIAFGKNNSINKFQRTEISHIKTKKI